MGNFEGKTALVTGGGSGLGEAISKDLAKNGVNVVVVDLNLDGATRVADEITAAGGTAVPFQANTAIAQDGEKSVNFAVATYGALNYAINNAGIGGGAKLIATGAAAGEPKIVTSEQEEQAKPEQAEPRSSTIVF